jgi:hypothetical protein
MADSYTYNQYFFKGLTIGQTCPDWTSFGKNVLQLPFDYIAFDKITLDVARYDFSGKVYRNVTAQCSDKKALQGIVSSLQSGATFAVNCEQRQWRVFQCDQQNVLCVNCKQNCVAAESCAGNFFGLSPCMSCKTYAAASAVFSAHYSVQILYPEVVTRNLTDITRTSVRVNLNVTAAGNIYCAAVASGTTLQSVLDIRRAGRSRLVTLRGVYTLAISGLQPDTPYVAYCYTEDFASHVMPLDTALLTAISFRTSCCRAIEIVTTYPGIAEYIPGNNRPELPFVFQLDSQPTRTTSVSLSLTRVSCADGSILSTNVNDAELLPASFSFGPTSTSLRGSFLVRASTIACYRVGILAVSGTTYAGNSVSFTLQSFRSAGPTPSLKTVTLSDAGTSVLFNFDFETNQASTRIAAFARTFNCSLLVSFPGSSASTCRWTSTVQLMATPNPRASVLPNIGNTAGLLASMVTAACVANTDCTAYTFVPATSLPITNSANPLQPTALLSAPASIASCDDIRLDPTLTRGYGGRAGTVLWSVTGSDLALRQADVAQYLNANFGNTFRIATIPNYFLSRSTPYVDSIYTITLSVTNFLLQTAISTVSVKVNQDGINIVPSIVLSGTADIVYRWQEINVFAAVLWPNCTSAAVRALPITYDWKLYKGIEFVGSAVTRSLDRRYFRLPAFTLDASSNYLLSLTASVTYGKVTISNYVTGTLQTGQSGMTATIAGAPVRGASTQDTITVDASGSRDIDYPTAALVYTWSCAVFSPSFGDPCVGFPTSSSSILTILPATMSALTYTITASVANSAGTVAVASVRIALEETRVPSVVMSSPQTKYNVESKVILTATIATPVSSATASWDSSTIADFSTGGYALTGLTRNLPLSASNIFQLSIGGDKLVAGLSYTFALSVKYDSATNARTSVTTVTITMNAAPSGGALLITPLTGQALTDDFTFFTSQWTDDAADLPLRYVLATYVLDPVNLNVIKTSDVVPYATSKLGQGLESLGYVINGVAIAMDIYSSTANVSSTVTVRQAGSTQIVVSTSTASLNTALEQGNPTAVVQSIGAAIPSLNAALCNRLPAPCPSINRRVCSETANTCGPCLAGFVGPQGDSNIPCRNVSALRQIGKSCNSGVDCATGQCVTGKCADVAKTCPNDCLGRGACVFYDLYGEVLSECSITDPSCRAACICNPDRFGVSCQLSAFEYGQVSSLRDKMCYSIYHTLGIQDVSADVVRTRAFSVGNILLDVSQLTLSGLANCTAALVETVTAYPDLACEGTGLTLVSNALSNVLSKGNQLPEELLNNVSLAISALSGGCKTSIGIGEDPLTITTGNLKMFAALVDSETTAGRTLSSPRSAFDEFNDVPPVTVAVDSTSFPGSDSLGLTLFEFTNNPKQIKTNSSKVTIKATKYGGSPSNTNGRRLAETSLGVGVTIVLQNSAPMYYINIPESTIPVRCFRYTPTVYYRNVTCPSGLELNITCPIYTKGVFNVTCPAERDEPQCTSYNGASYEVNPDCKVIAFSPYNTTCYCAGDSARRHLAGEDESGVEYSSSLVVIATNFATTFVSAPSLTDVQKNLVILSTLAGVVGLFILGMFATVWWDRKYEEQYKAKQDKKPRTVKYRTFHKFFESIFPTSLRDGPWYQVFWHNMLAEHPWVSLFAPQKAHKFGKTIKWSIVMGEMLIFLFVNSLLAALMYADDGYCENITDASTCKDARTTGNFFRACKWRTDNESCEFQTPEIDFYSTIVLTIIASLLVVPFEKLLHYSIIMIAQHIHYRNLESKIIPSDNTSVEHILQPRFDEFALAQTVRSTLFRAARLEKARRLMDYILPAAEAELVCAKVREDEDRWENNHAFKDIVAQASFNEMRYGFHKPNPKKVLQRIEICREQVANMKKELEQMSTEEEQEMYLMRHFIVDIFDGPRRGVVSRHFLETYNTRRKVHWEYCSIIFLPIMLAIMIYYVYVFNISIGSRSTNLWLVVVSINFVQDVFFLKPLKLWINFVLINGSVSHEVRDLCLKLSRRSKLIMMRTHGMVRDADALVQHFNPAVRAARMYPALPISRLLMSLNDHDIPHKPRYSFFLLPYVYFMAGLLSLTLLPEVLQESSLEILSNVLLNFGAVGFYQLGRASYVAAIVIALGLLGMVLLREWYVNGFRLPRWKQKVAVEDWSFRESMFHTLDDETDEGNALAQLAEKTLSSPPPDYNKNKLTMKSISEVQSKMFEDESDEEAVIVSDLINFDGVGDILCQPEGSVKLFTATPMGSVASLQRLRRPSSQLGSFSHTGQLLDAGSMVDDNSTFFTEAQSHFGSTMLNSRANVSSRPSSRQIGATYLPKSGILIPGMTPVAGPPIASFRSTNASLFEQSIASSMSINARLDSTGRKYLAERKGSFASEDFNDAVGDLNAASFVSAAPSEFHMLSDSKNGSPAQSTRKSISVDAASSAQWFRPTLYTGSQEEVDDNASYTKPFSAASARYAHPHTAATGLFGALNSPGGLGNEGSFLGAGQGHNSSWVAKGGRDSPVYYMGQPELKGEQEISGPTLVQEMTQAANAKGPWPAMRAAAKLKPVRNETSRSKNRRANRTRTSNRNRGDSEDFGDAVSVLTDDRGGRGNKFGDFVESNISKARGGEQGYVYRKYAGRLRRRGERGPSPSVAQRQHGNREEEGGPGGRSQQIRATAEDFDLSMQQHYQISADMAAPMPMIHYDEGADEPGAEAPVERFGLFPRAGSPSVVEANGPGGFLYASGEQSGAGQSSAFPMFQY